VQKRGEEQTNSSKQPSVASVSGRPDRKEENVKKELAKPWISFCSDEASQAPESPFTKSSVHPRAYGILRESSISMCGTKKYFQ
jgi:hypothetical protein